jgi:AraC-like DNA-binding protein
LADEGTTLRAVFDGVRLEAAVERLRDPHVSIAELAIELGFSDQTALTRAFRRWTGRSPAAFRRAVTRWASGPRAAGRDRPAAALHLSWHCEDRTKVLKIRPGLP